MTQTYLTTEGLAERIHYDKRTIRERMKDSVFLLSFFHLCLSGAKEQARGRLGTVVVGGNGGRAIEADRTKEDAFKRKWGTHYVVRLPRTIVTLTRLILFL